jgi:type I restriction enzyme S subunit
MSRELPEGWAEFRIEEILYIKRGVTWDKKNELDKKQSDAIPVISIPNIQEQLQLNQLRYIRRTSIANADKFVARSGWTLMVGSNGNPARVGNCVYASEVESYLFASFLLGIYPKNTSVLFPEYGYRILSSRFIQDAISASVQGTTGLRNISVKMLRDLVVMVPPLNEQRRIAEILSSVDDAIAATQGVIEQTKKVKQATLERLLTKGIGHTRFKQTEIGEIPDSWIISTADEICSQISVGIVIKPSRYYTDNGVRCFRSANVREGFIEDADWVFITEEGNRVNRKSILKTDDVLVVRTGYPGTSCVVTPEYDGANCIDIIFARPDSNRIESRFLSAFINSESGKLQVLKAEGGLAQKHFNVGSMKLMKIPLPTIAEQREIVCHIEDFTQAENSLKKLLEQYKCMKSALMSDLLTGRKRVTDTLPLAAE